jgi:hypothetical protein
MKNLKSSLEFALYYQNLGLSIIPTGPNKKPLIEEWNPYMKRCATVIEINNWWKQWPNANPALVTGMVSGVVALDLDKKHNRTSKEFSIPSTVCAKSAGGGEHFFFKHPQNVLVKNSSGISGLGVDSRGDGGYILLAPSVNEIGGVYEWIVPLDSKDNLAEMPEWFLKLTTNDQKEKKWLSGKDGVSEGSRNDTATSMAGKILSSTTPELQESIGWEQFKVWNTGNNPPLVEKELRNVWESIKGYHNSEQKLSKENSLLNEICNREDVTLFHDEQKDAYICLGILGHQEVWPCDGSSIKNLLSYMHWNKSKKPLGSEAVKSIVAVLEGKARFDGSEIKLHNRVAWFNSSLWYDLTNRKWQVVKIDKNGEN